ncbi:thiopurine S-methyltransferase [Hoeflea sp. TYP-13]|uniref:thiopurine S-methyltransferase n=1 Tax=Hoeflea sp. TYP-13 TaxID=3230023 RepID=UPI0034C64723
MDEEFWQLRWRENKIAFHENQPNELLLMHFHHLGLQAGDTIFVPLCGKTVDLDWLSAQGLRVVGVEFSKQAVEEIFARRNLVPEIDVFGQYLRYRSGAIEVFVGDIFELSKDRLGKIDAVYDRAALVALPNTVRGRYARHVFDLAKGAPQILIAFDYDQRQMQGPPFSVPSHEIRELYDDLYAPELLASRAISGPLSERCNGSENTWLLKSKQATHSKNKWSE